MKQRIKELFDDNIAWVVEISVFASALIVTICVGIFCVMGTVKLSCAVFDADHTDICAPKKETK